MPPNQNVTSIPDDEFYTIFQLRNAYRFVPFLYFYINIRMFFKRRARTPVPCPSSRARLFPATKMMKDKVLVYCLLLFFFLLSQPPASPTIVLLLYIERKSSFYDYYIGCNNNGYVCFDTI